MAYVIAKIGNTSNVPCWDIRCDTAADISSLEIKRIPVGSTVYIIEDGSLYMLNSQGLWKEQ